MRAKFNCVSVTCYGHQRVANLEAVTADNPENESFAQATPQGGLQISIDNPSAMDFFKPQKSYYLDFTECE